MAFTGIARPEVFEKTLCDLGGNVVSFKGYRDHHFFKPDEISRLSLERAKCEADLMVTTEKDWVRIENFAYDYPEMAFLSIKFDVISGTDRFFEMVKNRIEEVRAVVKNRNSSPKSRKKKH